MKLERIVSIAGLVILAAASQAVVIYDGIGASTTFTSTTGGTPRNRMADSFSATDPGSGAHWKVTSIDVGIWVNAASPSATAEVILWNEWNVAGFGGSGTNVFQNEAGRETFNLGDLSASDVHTLTFTTPIHLDNFQDLGLEIQLKTNGTKSNSLALSLQDAVPTVGSGTNLFYRDSDNDEVIETPDARTINGWSKANVMFRVNAEVESVPEPATMTVLGLGALALLRRRRQAK